jgi:folate-binding protein YgfZ
MTDVRYCRRLDLALVRVAGGDARRFLHAQTTQAIDDLGPGDVRLAAWLSPKGRVQALFDVIPDGESFWLLTAADNADWLAQRLRLFVLRDDVRIEAVSEPVVGSLTGHVGDWLGERSIDLGPGGLVRRDNLLWARISDTLVDVIGPGDALHELAADLPEGAIDIARAEEIAAGRLQLTTALRDRYIPQMLNLDRLDAVSFTKGCYPGQEIVTRTENLGQVKRRLIRLGAAEGELPMPGDGIVDTDARTAGEVVSAAATSRGIEILAVVQLELSGQPLALAGDGRALARERLPQDS